MNLAKHNIAADLLSYRDRLQIKKQGDNTCIFDIIRKKYIVLQPEEMVRQLCILWLIEAQGFSRNAIQVEKTISLQGLKRRFDIVVYDTSIRPLILVECKSPQTKISQAVFDQLASYQYVLQAPYLLVTNGTQMYITRMDYEVKRFVFFDKIPDWKGQY